MNKLKVNDTVKIIAGSCLGMTGKILKIDFKNSKVWVDGVNVKKYALKRTQENNEGGFGEKTCPVHISNVSIFDQEKNVISRIGVRKDTKGFNVRFAKKTNSVLISGVK
jgi:large subunit ribosomal protein L24